MVMHKHSDTLRRPRERGQVIVEFALASTILFFLLAAAVDLGLIYFSMQALRAAAQEGATFGSYPVVVVNQQNGQIQRVDLRYREIVDRVRMSGGGSYNNPRSVGLVNFYDLDNNGFVDFTEINNPRHTSDYHPQAYARNDAYIRIKLGILREGRFIEGEEYCPTDEPGQGLWGGGRNCAVQVIVRTDYRFFFPLAPAFGNTMPLTATSTMPIRSQYSAGSLNP